MKRKSFLLTVPFALSLGVAFALASSPAEASGGEGPGCFPEFNWDAYFLNGQVDPNNHLITGEWSVIANGRLHTLEILNIDGDVFTARYNGEDIKGSWDEDARRAEFYRTHPDGRGGMTTQNFVGYIMDVNPDDPKIRMAGTLTREAPPVTTYDHPDRLTYGFYATIDR